MKTRFSCVITLAALASMIAGCTTQQLSTTSASPTVCEGPRIVIGEISDDPEEVIRNVTPFANYLAAHLAPYGIACGEVKVPATTHEMSELINNGEVDVYWDSLYPATLVSDATGAQPTLRRWRNCDPQYYSVIFSRADSGIASIEDLKGHVIAMDNPESTSGFAMPAVYLINQDLALAVKKGYEDQVSASEVGIFFTFDDENTLALILSGRVSAAVTDDFYYGNLDDAVKSSMLVLGKTDSVPRQAVLLRSDLEKGLQEAITKELLAAHLNAEGLAALEQAAHTCKFDEFPQGIQASVSQMRQMSQVVSQIPGLPK